MLLVTIMYTVWNVGAASEVEERVGLANFHVFADNF